MIKTVPKDYADPRVERILRQNGLTFTLAELPLDEVNRYEDSQARIGDLDSYFVNRYTRSLQNKAVFPPIVVYRNGHHGYITLDGSHRSAASRKAGRGSIYAYIINEDVTQDEAVYISGVINATTNGKPVTSRDEVNRLVLAASRNRHGWSDERIGQELGLSRTKVRNIRITDQARTRLAEVGIDLEAASLSDKVIRELHSKIADDIVLKEAAALVDGAGLGGQELTDFVRSVEKAGSEDARLAVVRQERINRQPEIDGRGEIYVIPADIPRAVNVMKGLTVKHGEPSRWVPLTPVKRQELLGGVRDIVAFLTKVQDVLGDRVAEDAAAESGSENAEDAA